MPDSSDGDGAPVGSRWGIPTEHIHVELRMESVSICAHSYLGSRDPCSKTKLI